MNDEKSYDKVKVKERFNQIVIEMKFEKETLVFDHYDSWMNQVYAMSLICSEFPNSGIHPDQRNEVWVKLRESFPRIGFCVLNNHTIYHEPIVTIPDANGETVDVKPVL